MIDNRLAPYAATLLRVSLGVMLLAHGLMKVFVFTIPGTVGFFGKLGLPALLAYGVIAIEVVGGLMLIAGLFTRWVSLAAIPVLLGATWVHLGNGWVFSPPAADGSSRPSGRSLSPFRRSWAMAPTRSGPPPASRPAAPGRG